MKKFYSVLMMLAMMVAAFSFTACSSDDEGNGSTSAFVGTWDIVSNVYYSPDKTPEYDDVEGKYWVFTDTKLTVYDRDDIMNGKSVDYFYDSSKKQLTTGGLSIYTVLELTNTKMRLKSVEILGYYNIMTLEKR